MNGRSLAALCVVFVAVAVVPAPGVRGAPADAADREVQAALASAPTPNAQAQALVRLAWITPGVAPAVRERARATLVDFGGNAIEALAFAVDQVSPDQTADVVRTVLAAHELVTFSASPYLDPALVASLWVGSREAKRLAIPELARRGSRAALLPMVDSAIDDPALVPDVVLALGALGDDRARFYLEQVLNGNDPAQARDAAVALARIGGRALIPLHTAMRAPARDLRLTAARAILPVATDADLSALSEFITAHPDDDPQLTASIRKAAEIIEAAIEAQRAAEAASAPDDF